MTKKCKIVPKFPLPDLIMFRRVEFPCVMDLNKAEIKRAMNYADVFEILDDGKEVLLSPYNYTKDNEKAHDMEGIADVKGLPIKIPVIKVNCMGKAGMGIARMY